MKVTVTKTGNDNTVVATTYDGQGAFGIYTAIASDDDFRQLERNGVDGAWDIRLAAFKSYVLSEVGADVYALINWDDNTVISIDVYDIKIKAIENTGGQEVIAIVYKNGILSPTLETVTVYFNTLNDNNTNVPLQIASNYYSGIYSMENGDGTIFDITNISASPDSSVNGIYNVTLDTENTWDL